MGCYSHAAPEADSESDIEVSKALSPLFYSDVGRRNWEHFKSREILNDRSVDLKDFASHNLVVFFEKRKVIGSVTYVKPYVAEVVYHFYANLSHEFSNHSSKLYGKVYVHGKVFSITPSCINKFLGVPNVVEDDEEVDDEFEAKMAEVVTGGRAEQWIANKKPNRLASVLTSLFSTLHKICASNWLPTSNTTIVSFDHVCLMYKVFKGEKGNLGQRIFNSIDEVAMTKSNKKLIVPFLIFNMLIEQGLKLTKKDVLTNRLTLQTVQPAFLADTRTRDLPWIEVSNTDAPSEEYYCSVPVFLLQEQIHFFTEQIKIFEKQRRVLQRFLSSQKEGDEGQSRQGKHGGTGQDEDDE